MSNRVLDKVLQRLFCDRAFREQLRRDAAAALAEYDLTPEQRARLSKLQKRRVVTPTLTPRAGGQPFSLN